jgi:dinuclear metal center YbgI/SA1388 family protein
MATVNEVCRILEDMAPAVLAESWDNVGLLLGHRNAEVSVLMTCLTLTERVAAEAVDRGVRMIITHHPILFRSAKRLTDDTAEGRIIMKLMGSGIAVYSAHTAFDSASGGINQQLAEAFGLVEIRALRGRLGNSLVGAGRFGSLPKPLGREEFLDHVASVTGANWVQWVAAGSEAIQRVAVGCGAAGDFLEDAADAGCDTFVTGEARFHTAIEAESRGMNLVLLGHYASERPAMVEMAATLGAQLPDLRCVVSEQDRDPLGVRVYPGRLSGR